MEKGGLFANLLKKDNPTPKQSTQSLSKALVSKNVYYGVDLDKLMGANAQKGLPKVITICINFIKEKGNISQIKMTI